MSDVVNHPEHYTSGEVEPIDLIESQKLNFNRGNVVKYVTRAGRKQSVGKSLLAKELEDLNKAHYYLLREIERCKRAMDKSLEPQGSVMYDRFVKGE